jgi:hypothetical protein
VTIRIHRRDWILGALPGVARMRRGVRPRGLGGSFRPVGFERLEQRRAPAVTFQFDTTYDTSGFFTQNPAAMTVLEQAAQILGSRLNDSLPAIAPGGGNTWTATFFNPSNPGATVQVNNLSVPANTLVVYVGAAPLGGTELGEGASGTAGASGTIAWDNLAAARGQAGVLASPPTDFGPWGGAVSFDSGTRWSFSGTGGTPGAGQVDFLSVALHELSHVLGYGTAPSWFSNVNGTNLAFTGAHAEAVSGGPAPIDPTEAHWAQSALSGGTTPVMTPAIVPGVRRPYTPLDWAGLADIGWTVDQLVVTTPPPASVTAGNGFGLTVAVEDPDGIVDTTYSATVSLALGNQPPGATLGGSLTTTAVKGVATFSGLTLTQAAAGYTIVASGGSLPAVTTAAINVNAATATHLVVTVQPPASLVAGSGFGLTVAAEDRFGNIDPTYQASVALALAGNPGTLAGASSVTAVAGVAAFANLSLNRAGGGYTLQATSGTLAPATTASLSVAAAAASQLVVTSQPPGGVVAGSGFGLAVAAEDRFGNVDTTFNGAVLLALAAGPAGATLGGPMQATASAGIAAFAGLLLDQAAPADSLHASSGGLTPVNTTAVSVTAAPATQLVVTSGPPASVTAGSGFGLTIAAEDPFGNIDLTYSTSVMVALASNPVGATLSGTLALTPSAGVATFAGLVLDRAAQGDALQASSGHLSAATTSAFSVHAAAATHLVVTVAPPASVTAGSAFGLAVAAEDPFGNVDPSQGGTASVVLAVNPGGTTLMGTPTAAVTAGVATFAGLSLERAAGGYTLQVADGGFAPVVTGTFTVTAAPATQLVVTIEPPAVVTAGSPFRLTVSAEDPFGNVDPGFGGNVTLALASGQGASLGGTLTAAPAGGVAAFNGLSLDRAASGYAIQAYSGSLSATANAITVVPAPASHLVVSAQPPASVVAGSGFGFTVAVEDSLGNVDPSYTGSVTVAIAANAGSATLGGTLSVPVAGGTATFSGLSLNRPGAGYTLEVSSGSLVAVITGATSVSAGAASQLVVTSQPPASVVAASGFGLVVAAEDALGNIDPTFGGSVSVALAANPGGATLGRNPTVTAAAGVATFTGLTFHQAAAGYTLAASSGTFSTTTSAITVAAAPATHLVVTQQPSASLSAGSAFALTIAAEDDWGNVDPTFSAAVSLALASNPGALRGPLAVTAAGGVATFTGLTLDRTASYTVQATSGSLTAAVTAPITVTAAAATQLAVTVEPPAAVTAGRGFGLAVAAEDAFGNVDLGYSGSVTIALDRNPGAATLGGTVSGTPTAGVATFSGLTLDKAATGVTLGASSGTLATTSSSAFAVTPAPATHLVVTAEPPTRVTAGSAFGLTVSAEDGFGNVDPTFGGNVALALQGAPAVTLGGTLSVAAAQGVAAFAGLTLDQAGAGYTIDAQSSSLLSASTSSLAVIAAAATHLVLTAEPPAAVTAESGFALAVAAEDAFGNVDPTYGSAVAVALASNPGGATLGGTLSVPAAGGVAALAGLTLDKASSGYTLQVSGPGLTAATTRAIAVTAASATQLVVTTMPPVSVTAGAAFGLAVAAEDPSGNIDPSDDAPVTLSLGGGLDSATLGGPLTASLQNGVATFAGLMLDQAAAGYTLRASSAGLTPATTAAVTVTPAPAARLVVTVAPPDRVTAGSAFGLTVSAEDSFGNIDPSVTALVTLALAGNPGGATLGGPLTAAAGGGIALFSGLTLENAASGYVVQASAGGLAPASTSAFDVTAAPATQLVVTEQPPSPVNAGQAFGLTVAAEDPFGNVDPTYDGAVALAPAGNPTGATLGGPLGVATAGGVATFRGLTLDRGSSGVTLQATSGGLSPTVTSAVAVIPPPVTVVTAAFAVQLQQQKRGRYRPTPAILVRFSGALNAVSASNVAAYTLTTVAAGKAHKSRAVPLAQALYNPAAHTVTLLLGKTRVRKPPLQLRISGTSLTDALGRPLDGNGDGRPGGDSVTIVR